MKLLFIIFHIPIFLAFWTTMILFHPIFVLAHTFNKKLFEKLIVTLNKVHIFNAKVFAGLSLKVVNNITSSSENSPVIIISNHQSIYDIACLTTLFPKKVLYYVAKKQLGRNIPTVSFLLRNGNGILIDRSAGKEAVKILSNFATRLKNENLQVVIFPEGTRAKDGVLKQFKFSGLKSLMESAPNAQIVTAIIDGNWRLLNRNAWKPFSKVGVTITLSEEKKSNEEDVMSFLLRIEGKFKEQLATK